MIIIDPVTLGDAACTRASSKWVYDRTGTLVEVPANTLGVTYDPSDLSKAPYALVEKAATNVLPKSEQFTDASIWAQSNASPVAAVGIASPGKIGAVYKLVEAFTAAQKKIRTGAYGILASEKRTFSVFAKAAERSAILLQVNGYGSNYGNVVFDLATGQVGPLNLAGNAAEFTAGMQDFGGGWFRVWITGIPRPGYDFAQVDHDIILSSVGTGYGFVGYAGDGTGGVYLFGANVTPGELSSYIPTNGAAVTRAADVLSTTPGLVYSNVPEPEPLWVAGTYALGARVRDASHTVWESLVASNTAPLPAETDTKWAKVGATLQRAMFDQYNNTQTTAAEEVLVVLSPQAIAQGVYLGNVDASEIRVSVVDLVEGLVYRETKSLITPTPGSSFYNWAFSRIKRSNYFLTTKLPPYARGLVTLAIRKPGGTAKCGMCALGPVDEFGPSLVGLSTEGKDYSSTTFDSNGISSTKIRPYAKRMSVDVSIDNSEIDYVHTRLEELRQRPIVWVGGPYGSTAVFGRYGSFRNVIESFPRSKMALQIEGTV